MDRPTCSSSSTKTVQTRGESSSLQELHPGMHPSLLDKVQAPRLSNLGQKGCVQANPPPVGKERCCLTMQFQTFSQFLHLCKWILVSGWNNCRNNGAK